MADGPPAAPAPAAGTVGQTRTSAAPRPRHDAMNLTRLGCRYRAEHAEFDRYRLGHFSMYSISSSSYGWPMWAPMTTRSGKSMSTSSSSDGGWHAERTRGPGTPMLMAPGMPSSSQVAYTG